MLKRDPRLSGTLHVGTSNLVLPGKKQSLPIAFRSKSRLCYYSTLLNSIEVNSTFYKLPLPATLARWGSEVEPAFTFTFKLSRDVTHAKTLAYKQQDIDTFLNTVRLPDEQKGCLLIQFPGKIQVQYFEQVAAILQQLAVPDGGWRVCVEFRHSSWYNKTTFSMLAECNASLVLHDKPTAPIQIPVPELPVVYYRFHGPAGDYKGSYSDAVLDQYITDIEASLADGKDVFVYFNNTMGNAFANAQYILDH